MLVRPMLASLLVFWLAAAPVRASVLTFEATGVAGVSGFIQFDSTAFTPTFLFIPNTTIVGFSMTVLGEVFDLGDVDTGAFTLIDNSVQPPLIVNGAGGLADNGSLRIFFYPDGGNGTPTDGDAALAYFNPDFSVTVLPVRWVVATVAEPGMPALLTIALAALAIARRGRRGIT